jgi:hypothetical protein
MSTNDDAREIIGRYTTPPTAEFVARDLKAEGCLAPDPQIIRTPAELEALDPDTLVLDPAGYTVRYGSQVNRWDLPLAIVREGAEVRACREALGEATP